VKNKIVIKESDTHYHLQARMQQRGVSIEEIESTLNKGWAADDAKDGTIGRTCIFPYNAYWEEKFSEEKEVTVYYRYKNEKLILLTVKARYGKKFLKRER
jgi:hypothetical protein